MNRDRVLVPLDRGLAARQLDLLSGSEEQVPCDCDDCELCRALRAALDTDREQQVERVGEAIRKARFDENRTLDGQARAVLAALEQEGADDEC